MRLGLIHHIALIGHELERTRAFYVDKLGFEVMAQHQRADKGDIKLDLAKGSIHLEIFIKPAAPQRLTFPVGEATGLRHLAFKVEDVVQTAMELKKLGIETEPIRKDTFTGEKMTFFFDPDGLPLEIHE
ncbi:VOC family protein [Liquorilactobacillus satsumensis]|uniref:SMU1112c/YaeR family gloxylase I-like metalloprotein n=1 Tax=Liquorilactobacillus satsumensis TaxID=259059 RepID=UPI0006CFCD85|nr:VOC family protein [Liquorilactobacillus satsumensis]MCC7666426.1 VOC family protein [Liquorilactobacillus satsumensis]MCP9312994.1 VOC family protein [Liquorilactobacillus satsumensis]MCP9328940.1 VOC family protein [Liquorilactobacillus satsumensis]MCP9357649.1 VOC family protein [Liquorilactobacillus satsumensis]MCP9360150.1 VOC family protein [Liquorilactobacillus satsumensis]